MVESTLRVVERIKLVNHHSHGRINFMQQLLLVCVLILLEYIEHFLFAFLYCKIVLRFVDFGAVLHAGVDLFFGVHRVFNHIALQVEGKDQGLFSLI
jgi:hypothetical protein